MIVIAADTHKSTHSFSAVEYATGRVAAERTLKADRAGMLQTLRWGKGVGDERVWALHRIAVARPTPPARKDYLARKQAGKSRNRSAQQPQTTPRTPRLATSPSPHPDRNKLSLNAQQQQPHRASTSAGVDIGVTGDRNTRMI